MASDGWRQCCHCGCYSNEEGELYLDDVAYLTGCWRRLRETVAVIFYIYEEEVGVGDENESSCDGQRTVFMLGPWSILHPKQANLNQSF